MSGSGSRSDSQGSVTALVGLRKLDEAVETFRKAVCLRPNDSEARVLHVSTAAENGSVEMAVRDSGVGLHNSQVERLFEPFYTTKKSGIGMGLAINRTIIRAHRGRIWAASNEDRGATFRFRLPINHQTDAKEGR